MKNVEIEYKCMVSKEDFTKLKEKFKDNATDFFVQTNHYYDTLDRKLKENRVNLRIRHLVNKDEFIATVKEPRSSSKEGRIETEAKVKNNSNKFIVKEITDVLTKYGVNKEDLYEIGSLTTERYEFKYNGMTICLDKNNYLDCEDYEIECESNSMAKSKAFVISILTKEGINFKKSKKGKQARALQSNQ